MIISMSTILKRKTQEAPTSNVLLTVDLVGGDLDSDFLSSVTSPPPATECHCNTWKSYLLMSFMNVKLRSLVLGRRIRA